MDQIIERIKKAYHLETDAQVANFLDIKPSTLSMQKNRGRLNLKRIIEKCRDLNKNWLLEGVGPIRKSQVIQENGLIPIYSSIFLENGAPDFQKSNSIGSIFADGRELHKFSSPERMVGLIGDGTSVFTPFNNGEIAFFDLQDTTLEDDKIFMLSIDHNVICARIQEADQKFVINIEQPLKQKLDLPNELVNYQIIGKLNYVLQAV